MKINKYAPPVELKNKVAAKFDNDGYASTLDSLPERRPDNKGPIFKAVLSAAAMLVIAVSVTTVALIATKQREKPDVVIDPPASEDKEPQHSPAVKAGQMFFMNGHLAGGAENGEAVSADKMTDTSLSSLMSHQKLYTTSGDELYGVFIIKNDSNEIYSQYATGQYKGYYYIPLGTEVDSTLALPQDGIAFSQAELDNCEFHEFVTTATGGHDTDGNFFTDTDGDGNKEYLTLESRLLKLTEYDSNGNGTVIAAREIFDRPQYNYADAEQFATHLAASIFNTNYILWYDVSEEQKKAELTPMLAKSIISKFCETFLLTPPSMPDLKEYASATDAKAYAADVANKIKLSITLPSAEYVVLNGVRINENDLPRLQSYLASKTATEVTFTDNRHVATPTAHSLAFDSRDILITKDSVIVNKMEFKYDSEFLKPLYDCSLLSGDSYDITVTYNGETKEIRGHDKQYFILSSLVQWRPAMAECEYDVEITINGQKLYYHTECTSLSVNGGTFIGDTSNIQKLLDVVFI